MANTSNNGVETKVSKFLLREQKRQMVTGTFLTYRNVGRDSDVIKLVAEIQEKTSREDGVFMILYAQRRIYTVNLEFDWHPSAPAYYTNLEKWWDMVQDGESEEECYLFYVNNCHNIVGSEWQEALEDAQTLWVPPEEGWDDGDGMDVATPTDPLGLENPTRKKKKVADPN